MSLRVERIRDTHQPRARERDHKVGGEPEARPLAEDDLPLLIGGDKILRAPTILEAATALNLRAPNKTGKKPGTR